MRQANCWITKMAVDALTKARKADGASEDASHRKDNALILDLLNLRYLWNIQVEKTTCLDGQV